MKKRLAIIPARGGSKRIPKKNIKDFCGNPIISYVLEAVKSSNLFDTIHVSTDSNEIAKVVKKLGFSVDFMRKDELSDDYTPIMPVLKWVLEQYKNKGESFDEVATIMPCAPFIESNDLLKASNLLKDNNLNKPVLAVSKYSAPIEWAFSMGVQGTLYPVQKEMLEKRSQDLNEYYFDTGSFAFFSTQYILNSSNAGISSSYIGSIIDKYKAVDIDNLDDWKFAEAIFYGINQLKLEK
jgi:pseudaminic acid cytidylyltransferase